MSINQYFPLLIILFFIIGWILATGTSKTQYVRIIDVLLYGPYLMYLAYQREYIFGTIDKLFLLFLGTTTISYNLRNYLAIQ